MKVCEVGNFLGEAVSVRPSTVVDSVQAEVEGLLGAPPRHGGERREGRGRLAERARTRPQPRPLVLGVQLGLCHLAQFGALFWVKMKIE